MAKRQAKRAASQASEDAALPPLSLGLIGHVDHGKTTLVQSLSGKWTDTHSEELKRGITIRLGYADVRVFKEGDAFLPEHQVKDSKNAVFHRLITLVDAPGHESLMATMLSGASIFDGALLLVAANEKCPQAQTQEHLMALEIMNVSKLIVVQNKVDMVSAEQAKKNYDDIKKFLSETAYKDAPIIPISARHSVNIDVLLGVIDSVMQVEERSLDADPAMYVVRSFDVNKPGTAIDELRGGVLGGVLRQGVLRVGDAVDILPGYDTVEKNQRTWHPLSTTVQGLLVGGKNVDEAHPGGTFAVLTTLDPSIVKSDKLGGGFLGLHGKTPLVWSTITLEVHLLERQVHGDDRLLDPLKMGEWVMLNVNSAATVGRVVHLSKDTAKLELKRPVCANTGARITISRRQGTRWRLVGYGLLQGE